MRGDILIIDDKHRQAAQDCVQLISADINAGSDIYIISVAGESGAGKSEVAASIAELLEQNGISTYIFQQDDYFVFPPKTNSSVRKSNIDHVGMGEVKIGLLDEQLNALMNGVFEFEKPLVIFEEDRITSEAVNLKGTKVFIAEGTYTTALDHVHCRIFIDRTVLDTKADRLKRNRETQDEWLEKILMIEHEIISAQKERANIIITKDYHAVKKEDYEG